MFISARDTVVLTRSQHRCVLYLGLHIEMLVWNMWGEWTPGMKCFSHESKFCLPCTLLPVEFIPLTNCHITEPFLAWFFCRFRFSSFVVVVVIPFSHPIPSLPARLPAPHTPLQRRRVHPRHLHVDRAPGRHQGRHGRFRARHAQVWVHSAVTAGCALVPRDLLAGQ